MIMSAVLAAALNAVSATHPPQTITVQAQNMADLVRDIHESVDRRGNTHLTGHDKRNRPFDLTVHKDGQVEGSVGAWNIAFHAADAS